MNTKFLMELLSTPTAPFRESLVVKYLTGELAKAGVPHFIDPIGNIVVGAKDAGEYQSKLQNAGSEPVRFFIAHTDHPGFHGVEWTKKGTLKAKWHGGAPVQKLAGASVWLSQAEGYCGQAKIVKAVLTKTKSSIAELELAVAKSDGALRAIEATALFGGFQFRKPVWKQGSKFYTKAADDLVGCAVIVETAKRLYEKGQASERFMGLLTRAEEVGFIGAIAHFELGWLQKAPANVVCVSLETSRTLPQAIVGQGPVVRLGDRVTVFSSDAVQIMTETAARVLPKKYQRRIMDGGACEATAAVAFGFKAMGISIPLGNYHNQSFEGGPGSRGKLGPAPEFVDQRDIEGMEKLCFALVADAANWQHPWHSKREDLIKRRVQYQTML